MSRRGFTLIEVLLAVLVMGLFFAMAFTQQARSVVLESRARLEAAAAAQVRCKMAEIEQRLQKDGFPLTDEFDSGPCCEAYEDERFQCSWSIQSIELPSVTDLQSAMQHDRTRQTLVATREGEESMSFQEQTMGLLSMHALGQILPLVQGFLRDAIRKVEVTIVWQYRNRVFDFKVTQYVTDPAGGKLGAFLQADLVQRLMRGGPMALMELMFGGREIEGAPGAAEGGKKP